MTLHCSDWPTTSIEPCERQEKRLVQFTVTWPSGIGLTDHYKGVVSTVWSIEPWPIIIKAKRISSLSTLVWDWPNTSMETLQATEKRACSIHCHIAIIKGAFTVNIDLLNHANNKINRKTLLFNSLALSHGHLPSIDLTNHYTEKTVLFTVKTGLTHHFHPALQVIEKQVCSVHHQSSLSHLPYIWLIIMKGKRVCSLSALVWDWPTASMETLQVTEKQASSIHCHKALCLGPDRSL